MSPTPDDTRIAAWLDGTLAPFGKLEVHRRGLKHPAVSVFVTCGDRTLLQRRALGKYHTPGLWANTCCTHPHWGEAPEHCATRRLSEELGLTGLRPLPRDRVEYRADVGNGLVEHEVVEVFVAETGEELTPLPDPEEVMDWRWQCLRGLKEDLARHPEAYVPWLRVYLEKCGEAIFGNPPRTG